MKVILLVILTMCLGRSTPSLSETRWTELDVKINYSIGVLHHLLGAKQIPSDEAANQLGQILTNFLESEPEFSEIEKEFFKRKQSTTLEEARILKRELKKVANKKNSTQEQKGAWLKAVKLYAFLLKKSKEKEESNEIRKQENSYRKNFSKFAKEACSGTLGKEKVQPSFNKEDANRYYQAKYGQAAQIDVSKLNWFVPVSPPTHSYDQSVIKPAQVKAILTSKAANTAPGEDGLLYGVLAKLPSVHHILATLYTRTQESCLAPSSWSSSLVVLAHKDGDTADPAVFRMIALTSCLGKPYHQIKADRMASFMTKNNYIDESSQKAFLCGINGCTENIQVMQEFSMLCFNH